MDENYHFNTLFYGWGSVDNGFLINIKILKIKKL
jgi:hypothetical protein